MNVHMSNNLLIINDYGPGRVTAAWFKGHNVYRDISDLSVRPPV